MNPNLFSRLEALESHFQQGAAGAEAGVALAVALLREARRTSGAAWPKVARQEIATHPLMARVRQCPLTRRCAHKPRGYAGDAVMIDYLYGEARPEPAALDPVASAVFAYCVASAAGRAVRYRRYRLADLIDRMAVDRINGGQQKLRVLSVAAGHGRELALSAAFRQGLIGEFVALDQDTESLAELTRAFGGGPTPVTAVPRSVRTLLTGRHELGGFDLIYSAGLYDYLETAVAQRLTRQLFEALNPGGRLLYANFAPEIHDVGYMEAAMDWWLIYRDAVATRALAREVEAARIAQTRAYTDPDDNIHFVELVRCAA